MFASSCLSCRLLLVLFDLSYSLYTHNAHTMFRHIQPKLAPGKMWLDGEKEHNCDLNVLFSS